MAFLLCHSVAARGFARLPDSSSGKASTTHPLPFDRSKSARVERVAISPGSVPSSLCICQQISCQYAPRCAGVIVFQRIDPRRSLT
jgi:hypothetical protein